ncbi:unnamed protein product [Rhizophagus irregularis]|nr:unnamed protein product [Rhizophagus irregularis]
MLLMILSLKPSEHYVLKISSSLKMIYEVAIVDVILYIEFFIKYLHANDSSILLSINVTNIIDPHSKHIR